MTESAVPTPEQARPHHDQTWADRNDGWEHTDDLGRWVGLRYSRFHGLMVSTNSDTVYIDQAEPGLREWLGRKAGAGEDLSARDQEPPL